jgi:hypothetical protein
MESMFENAKSFNQPLNEWTIQNDTDTDTMFMEATEFNKYPRQLEPIRQRDNISREQRQQEREQREQQIQQRDETNNEITKINESSLTINPVTDEGEDYIEYTTRNVSEYLKEDPDNIVFYKVINESQTPVVDVFLTKSNLKAYYTDNSAIRYECSNSTITGREIIIENKKYYSLRSIGVTISGIVDLLQIKEIVENDNIKCVIVNPQILNTFTRIALHGNSGQPYCKNLNENVHNIEYFPINLSGGKRKTKQRRNKRKTKNKRKIKNFKRTKHRRIKRKKTVRK